MDLDLNHVLVRNAHDEAGAPREILPDLFGDECVVALGEAAASRLKAEGIKHFKLPHPSPKNPALNDRQELARQLYRCKKFIYGT